jgi:outer membrane receptor for ferrienterochelin and colicins
MCRSLDVRFRSSGVSATTDRRLAFERSTLDARHEPTFSYEYNVPGVFLQDDVDVQRWLALSLSGRVDAHNRYGSFVSPRISALVRRGPWTSRASIGSGFFAPSALTEETEAAGLARLKIPDPLQAERGRSTSLDVTHAQGPFSLTATVFRYQARSSGR